MESNVSLIEQLSDHNCTPIQDKIQDNE